MTAIKINPAKLPYRGEPTRDRKPSIMLPEDAVIVMVTGDTLRKTHDKWLDKHLVHVKRGLEKQCKNHRYANMWTDEIDAKLMSLYWENVTYEEIAEVIGRTPDAVRTRANKIRRAQGMRPRKAKMNYTPWQESEDKILIKMWNAGRKAEDIAKALPGRTVGAIYMRSVYLRESLRIPMEQRKRRAYMCVRDATKNQDVSSKEGSAPNIEASNQSRKKLKLLCNPQRLPKPKVPRAEKKPVTTEAKYIIRDYFAWQYMKREKYAREVRWIKK